MVNERPVLVTGVAGFIGSHVAAALVRADVAVIGVDRSTAPPPDLQRFASMTLPDPELGVLLADVRPRALVHCAGRASVAGSFDDPADDRMANLDMTGAVLDAVRTRVPDCHVIFLSSAAVYGNPSRLPVTEDAGLLPLSPYGQHKMEAEGLCRRFSMLPGTTTTILRVFSAYGPGLRRQVLWDICERALTKGRVSLHGRGSESRDFIFVDDIADACRVLIDARTSYGTETYNVASGVETTIASLANDLVHALDVDVPVVFDGVEVPGDPLNWRADITRLRDLGWAPATDLDAGIASFVSWARGETLGG